MEDSSEKQELLNRLDAIDGIQSDSYIDGGKESFEPISHQATLAVEAAEESSSYKDYLYAKDLVDDLPFSLLKTQLLYRLSQIEIVDKVVRLGGKDRINTAILTSQSAYSQADNVILSGFGADVDALTGSLLAAVKDGPMLISRKNKLSPEVEKELDRLNAKKVYLLGGSNAISKNVEEEIKKLGYQVERIGGKNRYETAAKIAKSVKDQTSSHAFIVLGVMENPNDALADALAIGPVSARDKSPVFLVNTNSVPSETRQALTDLKIKSVTIIGGLSAVSPIVSIDLYLSNIQVLRVSGEDRYQTALEIAKKYYPDSNKALIANGRSSADALIGGYLGNLKNAPILLSEKDKLSDNTKTYIKDNLDNAIILGGDAVISSKVEADINKLIK